MLEQPDLILVVQLGFGDLRKDFGHFLQLHWGSVYEPFFKNLAFRGKLDHDQSSWILPVLELAVRHGWYHSQRGQNWLDGGAVGSANEQWRFTFRKSWHQHSWLTLTMTAGPKFWKRWTFFLKSCLEQLSIMQVVSHNQCGSFGSQLASDRHEANGCDGCMWNSGSTIGCTQLRCKKSGALSLTFGDMQMMHLFSKLCHLRPTTSHTCQLFPYGALVVACEILAPPLAVWSSIRSSDVKRVELCHWLRHAFWAPFLACRVVFTHTLCVSFVCRGMTFRKVLQKNFDHPDFVT